MVVMRADQCYIYLLLDCRTRSGSVADLLVHSLSTILQLQTDDVGFDEGGGGGGGGDVCATCPSAGHRWCSLWW